MRGLWDSSAEAAPAKTPIAETNALSVSSARRMQTAVGRSRDITASIGPFPTQDRVPTDVALAYAAQADGSRADVGQARRSRTGRRHQQGHRLDRQQAGRSDRPAAV